MITSAHSNVVVMRFSCTNYYIIIVNLFMCIFGTSFFLVSAIITMLNKHIKQLGGNNLNNYFSYHLLII